MPEVEVTVLSTWPLIVTTIDSPLADVATGICDTSILFVTCEFLLGGGVTINTGPTCVTAPVFTAPTPRVNVPGLLTVVAGLVCGPVAVT